ncbi:lipoprotein [Pseudomonas cichorii]|uniref:Lipoprotein n=1 Tax=Pseudomonas serbiensis TaxID=3064350 RepID=A0ABT9CL98_9PSED|nr:MULTISPECIES: hypothetical protein [Pseudomonas]MDO7925532.1 hypothetical protein [Pseudomonas sp. KFB-138]GFM81193.1 lipoprotein [Pseudomonas cichorii]
MIKPIYAALLTCSLVVMAGCDQVETSTKQILDTAANTAKQAIDDTHEAATKALEDTRKDLSVLEPRKQPESPEEKSGKEI